MSLGEDYRTDLMIEEMLAYDLLHRGIWVTKAGVKLNVKEDMTKRHIRNCIRMLSDNNDDFSREWVKVFEKELERRDGRTASNETD